MKWSRTNFERLSEKVDNLTFDKVHFFNRNIVAFPNNRFKSIGSWVLYSGANKRLIAYIDKMDEIIGGQSRIKDVNKFYDVEVTYDSIKDRFLNQINEIYEEIDIRFSRVYDSYLISDIGDPSEAMLTAIDIPWENRGETDAARATLLPYVKAAEHARLSTYRAISNNEENIFKTRVVIKRGSKVFFEATLTKYLDSITFIVLTEVGDFSDLKEKLSSLGEKINTLNDNNTSIPTLGRKIKSLLKREGQSKTLSAAVLNITNVNLYVDKTL